MARQTATKSRARVSREERMQKEREARAEKFGEYRDEQEKHAAILRGEAVSDDKVAKADEGFRAAWLAQQRLIYPEIYRVADLRLEEGGEPSAQPGVPIGPIQTHPTSLEPGHDPTLQARFNAMDEDDLGEETAGTDNAPPHETTQNQTGSQVGGNQTTTEVPGEKQAPKGK